MRNKKALQFLVYSEKGVALLMSMWALVMLSVMALNFSVSTRSGMAGTRNFKEDTNAYYLAASVYEEALDYLLSDSEKEYDYIDEDGNFRVDDEHPPITGEREVQGAMVTLTITDEESRLNLNKITSQTLNRVLEYAEMPSDASTTIMDSLADWMDGDEITRPSGAEDDYYEDLGYKTKSGRLEVPEELLLVKGFTADYLYGSEYNAPLFHMLTTWGDGLINVNTVSEELLVALGWNAIEIDAILKNRTSGGPLRQVPSGFHMPAKTASSFFRIEVAAKMPDSPQTVRITAIVGRELDKGSLKIKPVYWREEVENSGA